MMRFVPAAGTDEALHKLTGTILSKRGNVYNLTHVYNAHSTFLSPIRNIFVLARVSNRTDIHNLKSASLHLDLDGSLNAILEVELVRRL